MSDTSQTWTPEAWGHWCHNQEPVSIPITEPRCIRCGAMNLTPSRPLLEANPDPHAEWMAEWFRSLRDERG